MTRVLSRGPSDWQHQSARRAAQTLTRAPPRGARLWGVATRAAARGLGQPDVTPHPEVFTFEKWWRLQVPEQWSGRGGG